MTIHVLPFCNIEPIASIRCLREISYEYFYGRKCGPDILLLPNDTAAIKKVVSERNTDLTFWIFIQRKNRNGTSSTMIRLIIESETDLKSILKRLINHGAIECMWEEISE